MPQSTPHESGCSACRLPAYSIEQVERVNRRRDAPVPRGQRLPWPGGARYLDKEFSTRTRRACCVCGTHSNRAAVAMGVRPAPTGSGRTEDGARSWPAGPCLPRPPWCDDPTDARTYIPRITGHNAVTLRKNRYDRYVNLDCRQVISIRSETVALAKHLT